MNNNDFLGRGWSFPVTVDAVTGRIRTVSFEEDIQQAIKLILLTQQGERVMRPEFGSQLQTYAFRELNATTLSQVEEEIRDALVLYEQRITEIEVRAIPAEALSGRLDIHISYVVRVTNSPFNLVYPYFLNEGMGE